MTERLHFHFLLSCTGEGNGNPLQYSCLENPRDKGAWEAAVHEVAKSRTRLSNFTFLSFPFLSFPFKPHMNTELPLIFPFGVFISLWWFPQTYSQISVLLRTQRKSSTDLCSSLYRSLFTSTLP